MGETFGDQGLRMFPCGSRLTSKDDAASVRVHQSQARVLPELAVFEAAVGHSLMLR